jgi:hypothetical protein
MAFRSQSGNVPFLVVALFAACASGGENGPGLAPIPRASLEQWAKRVRTLAPSEGWNVSIKEDAIVIQRNKPIQWQQYEINGPGRTANEPPPKARLHDGVYRLTLKFGTKMPMAEYERLAAENAATSKEHDRLERGIRDIDHKFDQYVPSNDEEKKRLADFRAAEAKLKWHELPDMYCDEGSIWLLTSDDGWSSVYGDADREECDGVKQSVLRYFGMYDPAAAKDGRAGRPENVK